MIKAKQAALLKAYPDILTDNNGQCTLWHGFEIEDGVAAAQAGTLSTKGR